MVHMLLLFFVVFKNLKSFSEGNMPVHALDVFIENATDMVWINLFNAKSEDQTLW